MPKFVNPSKGYLLITSYKVMYSSLKDQESLLRLSDRDVASYLFRNFFKFKRTRIYILVRDPYSRLISFYEDKFKRHPSLPEDVRKMYGDLQGWQKCQKIFFPYLNIEPDFRADKISGILQSFSFKNFVNLLPKVYGLDPHLRPQSESLILDLQFSKMSVRIRKELKPDILIKIENSSDKNLLDGLALDLTVKKNSTKYNGRQNDDYFDPSLYEIVNRIYKSDFEMFRYSLR